MIDKIHNYLMRPWLLAGIATMVLTGPASAQDWTHDPADTSGAYGPNAWSDAFPCAGLTQSPVDIPTPIAPQSGFPLVFDYQDIPLVVTNTGNVIEVVVPAQAGGSLTVGADVYDLERIQFHAPAEHLIGGDQQTNIPVSVGHQYPMEAHLIHSNASGQVAIVAVWLDIGTPLNSLVDQIFTNAPGLVGTSSSAGLMNAADLLPASAALLTSSVDMPIEYTPVAYSPFAETAMGYTPVARWAHKDSWKANWNNWKKALSNLFNQDNDAEIEKRRATVKARKAAKAAAREARWSDKQAHWEKKRAHWEQKRAHWEEKRAYSEKKRAHWEKKRARWEEKLARWEEKRAEREQREGNDGTSGDDGTAGDDGTSGDDGTPPGDTGTPPGDTGTPPVTTALQIASYYEYTGSLTMPPCTGSVRWFVLEDTALVSSTSVNTMHDLVEAFPNYTPYRNNNRPTQGLFGRTILHIQ